MTHGDHFDVHASLSQPAVDVVIAGGGLAGTLAAILLGRAGVQVALIDPCPTYPAEFRAEQLVGYQLDLLSRLGLLDFLIADVSCARQAVAIRAGRVLSTVRTPHYGISYEDMVNRARRQLPARVRVIHAKVTEIDPSADRQLVTISTGELLDCRLVVIASGLGQKLQSETGIGKTVIDAGHSISFGFDLKAGNSDFFDTSVLVAYGENPDDRIDYLTVFAIGRSIRANLFTYHAYKDPRVAAFIQDPAAALRQAMPHLEDFTGRLQSTGPARVRVIDLKIPGNHRREGVVLIGDAFQTSCPAAGTGIGRLLNDIDRLCLTYIPAWLATRGMGADKISQYYDDSIKRACDAEALRLASYRRSVTVETSLAWKLHRRRVALQNILRSAVAAQMSRFSGTDKAASDVAWLGSSMAPGPLVKEPRRMPETVD